MKHLRRKPNRINLFLGLIFQFPLKLLHHSSNSNARNQHCLKRTSTHPFSTSKRHRFLEVNRFIFLHKSLWIPFFRTLPHTLLHVTSVNVYRYLQINISGLNLDNGHIETENIRRSYV
ncbi:hypothetical protein Hanom_Chr05g00446191 [Helianthus anomalus]